MRPRGPGPDVRSGLKLGIALAILLSASSVGLLAYAAPSDRDRPAAAPGIPLQIPAVGETYPVTFEEHGLPNGTNWSIRVNGASSFSSGESIVVDLGNGSYTYAGYAASNGYSNGSFDVQGGPTAVGVTWTASEPVSPPVSAGASQGPPIPAPVWGAAFAAVALTIAVATVAVTRRRRQSITAELPARRSAREPAPASLTGAPGVEDAPEPDPLAHML